jgi:Uma2 family endonuclease
MVSTQAQPLPPPNLTAERRVLLRNVSWETYEALLRDMCDRSGTRLTYHQGLLEITMLSEEHETASRLIELFISILPEELGLNIRTLGSTTLKRPELSAGAEPDDCYYIANEPLVRGRPIDLERDPPPDLVVEVDISNTDINRNVLYAQIGVPEFWRYNGQVLTIYQLRQGQYQEVSFSPTFPWLAKTALYQFLQNCREQGETQTKKAFRTWIAEQTR